MRVSFRGNLALTATLLVGGCASAGRTATWERQGASSAVAATGDAATVDSLRASATELWAERDDRRSLEEAIAVWEKLVKARPQDAEVLSRLARAYYFLADGFIALEDDQEPAELAAYQKGVDYGERALLVVEPEFERKMRAGASFEEGITLISNDGLEAAYWYCANLGRFASKKGLSQRLYYKDKLRVAMERIREVDPTFYYGAADRYLGAFYSLLPGFAGRDTNRSADHFKQSIDAAPEYLSTKVVKAQFLATALDDEAMYRQLLEEVLAASDSDNPDIAPENRAAKRTARRMLDRIDEVF